MTRNNLRLHAKNYHEQIKRFRNAHGPVHQCYLVLIAFEQKPLLNASGGSRISGKGVHMYKAVGVRFAGFILPFLNIP